MKQFVYTITDENGIHARPAGQLVQVAKAYESEITLTKGDKTASAKKLFALMGLGVKQGDPVTVTVEGSDEAEAAAGVEAFLKANL